MSTPRQLDVYDGESLVGALHDTDPMSFAYNPSWLQRPDRQPIAHIALQEGMQQTAAVQAYFENLLPEGILRETLALQHHATSVFGMLAAIAGDTVGQFVLVPAGHSPQSPAYTPTSWKAVGASLQGTPSGPAVPANDRRLSLAGAQRKTSISIDAQGQPLWPQGHSPSTHIVKPDIQGIDGVWASAANETLLMRTAHHCGLDTAQVFYQPQIKACVVARFDRVSREGHLRRNVQYDFCQLMGMTSGRKYEADGGPGLKRCLELIGSHSASPAGDIKRLMEWLFFNLMTGNNDSHAKNLSMHQTASGMRLTPFYDLMCTRLYPGLSPHFAFSLGGETQPGNMGRQHIERFASDVRVKPAYLLGIAQTMHNRLALSLDKAVQDLGPQFGPQEHVLAEKLQHKIRSIYQPLARRLGLPGAT